MVSVLGGAIFVRVSTTLLIILTGLVGLYYLDFYFDYQELQAFSGWIPWFEYLPFYLLLALEFRENSKRIIRHPTNKD